MKQAFHNKNSSPVKGERLRHPQLGWGTVKEITSGFGRWPFCTKSAAVLFIMDRPPTWWEPEFPGEVAGKVSIAKVAVDELRRD